MEITTPIFNILLADDDPDDRFFFKKALQELPVKHHLQTVSDGEQLVTYLQDNVDHLPDVLFLDINMPRMNGKECLAFIKKDQHFKCMVVVINSTSLSNDSADSLYELGAHYYLQKCDFTEMGVHIGKVLDLLAANKEQPMRCNFIINQARSYNN